MTTRAEHELKPIVQQYATVNTSAVKPRGEGGCSFFLGDRTDMLNVCIRWAISGQVQLVQLRERESKSPRLETTHTPTQTHACARIRTALQRNTGQHAIWYVVFSGWFERKIRYPLTANELKKTYIYTPTVPHHTTPHQQQFMRAYLWEDLGEGTSVVARGRLAQLQLRAHLPVHLVRRRHSTDRFDRSIRPQKQKASKRERESATYMYVCQVSIH